MFQCIITLRDEGHILLTECRDEYDCIVFTHHENVTEIPQKYTLNDMRCDKHQIEGNFVKLDFPPNDTYRNKPHAKTCTWMLVNKKANIAEEATHSKWVVTTSKTF